MDEIAAMEQRELQGVLAARLSELLVERGVAAVRLYIARRFGGRGRGG